MLETTARIRSGGYTVEAAIARWPSPIEFPWRDERAVVSMIYQPSSYRAHGQYVGGAAGFEAIGSIFMIPPNHELIGRGPGGQHRVLRCIFDPDTDEGLFERMSCLTTRQLSRTLRIGTATIAFLLRRLAQEAQAPGLASALMVQSLGSALLVECARQLFAAGAARESGYLDFVDERIDRSGEARFPSVAELARLCGLTPNHFGKRFQQETGRTIGRYLSDARMRRALALLAETDLPLKEVSFRLGFANTANFSTSFRAIAGQSPGAWRRTQH